MRTKQPWRILFNIYINIENYQAFFCISTHCENWKRKKRENMLSFMWKLISTEEHMAICVHVHLVILISKYFFLLYFRSYISRAHITSSQLHWLGNCYKWFALFFVRFNVGIGWTILKFHIDAKVMSVLLKPL